MPRKSVSAPQDTAVMRTPHSTGLDHALRQLVGYTMKRATHLMQADAARVLEP